MLEQIKNVLVEALNINGEDIVVEASLQDDLGIDSLSAVELSLELEEAFDIEITDEELAGLVNVQDIITLVEAKKG